MSDTSPAPRPFTVTITSGSLADILRVKLLSIPHMMQAANTPSALKENPHLLVKSVESRMLASVIKPIAHHAWRPIASLKTIAAINVVATPSKFKRRDAVAAGAWRRLIMSIIGAITPPARIAPTSHGQSDRARRASFCSSCTVFSINFTHSKPNPEPRYSNAANNTGEISPNNNLESGALAPKRKAANNAWTTGMIRLDFKRNYFPM